ncbi:MAG TPA: dihydrofolate reductase, partial [Acidimicrobiia bacterium]|nr:dihydrofolate reductase [Acidimicrobiia bacterium]
MPVTIVAAVARNGVIGLDGDIPWHLPDDLRRFKEMTMGGTLVMGRKTYESIGRPLPGRRTIVISGNPDLRIDGVETASSLEEALAMAGDSEIFVVGGGEIYRQA